jgi:hypothetical protein
MRDSITATRERVQKNILVSELYRQEEQRPRHSSTTKVALISGGVYNNPLEDAARQYIRDHGTRAFNKTILTLVEDTLA